jgi:hypothetical protein
MAMKVGLGPDGALSRRSRLMSLTVALTACAVAASVATTSTASAERSPTPAPPGDGAGKPVVLGTQVLDDASRRSAALEVVADRISRVGANLPGFAGIELKVDAGTIIVYWHGQVPDEVDRVLRDLHGTARIELRPARYSLKTLDAEARRIAYTYRGGVTRVTGTMPLTDYSGVQVDVEPAALTAARQTITSSVPITFAAVASKVIPSYYRWNDAEPFWAGAVIRNGITYCTTAFGARNSTNTTYYQVSARHCGNNRDWYVPDSGIRYGHADYGLAGLDSMYISGESYAGRTYVGEWDSALSAANASSWSVYLGTYYCTSGGFSGEVCRNNTTAVNKYVTIGSSTYGPGFWVSNVDNRASSGEGDSGGPVHSPSVNYTVYPKGMIVAIEDTTAARRTCEGRPDVNRICSRNTFSVYGNRILGDVNLTLLLG